MIKIILQLIFLSLSIQLLNCQDNDPETIELLKQIQSVYSPIKILLFKDLNDKNGKLSTIAKWTEDYTLLISKPTVYICNNYTCNQPTSDI